MMRVVLKLWLMLVAVVLLGGTARAASFTASLDREAMVLGEQATLSLVFEGGQSRNVPTPAVSGLQFTQAGTSQSVNIINGAMTSTVTITFIVTAQQAGEFTIPAMTADLNGQQLSSDPIKLSVTKVSAPSAAAVNSGNEVAFMKFVLPKNKIYLGQPVVGQLQLYLRDDVQRWGNFQLNAMPLDGFSPGKTTELQNQNRRVQIGNRVYTVIPLAVPMTPIKTGSLVLGPFTAGLTVLLPYQNGGGDPAFRFFNQGEQKQVTVATDPVTVDALPLPEPNKPASFSGAVGNFTMSASVGPTNLTAGDPITVRVQISGSGALDTIQLPPQDAWHNFKTYPPTTKLETSDQYGFQGVKTFEQVISPENSDVHELPPLTFSFFNPDDGQYHTLTHAAVPLVVHAAGATPMPALAAKNPNAENQSPQDILPIKEKLGTLETNAVPLAGQPAFLAIQSLPVLAFVAAFVWRKRTDSLANNPRLRRKRAVAQLMAGGLDDLKKFAAANQPDEFFALLFRLLQEQLGERLDCPATAITESVVGDRLVKIGAGQATLESVHELFQLCNQARYAPVRGTSELNSLVGRFQKTIGELQELKA